MTPLTGDVHVAPAPDQVTPYRSPLLAVPGAVEAEPPDAGVAAHYGDPYAEQRALAAGHGLVDLSHRPVIRVSGPDRLGWLHTLTSQHVAALDPAVATTALILSPHGHVEHALHLVDDGSASWLSVEPGTSPALVGYLARMRFWSDVLVEDVSTEHAVVWQPLGAAVPAGLDVVAAWTDPGTPTEAVRGRELTVRRAGLQVLAERAGEARPAGLAGVWAHEAMRIVAGRPRLGLETDHRTIPHEVDWIRDAVHLAKGCYRGQETVARVQNLGRPPRRLVRLLIDGSADHLPAPGAPVVLDGREVGRVTSSARHHELGPVALAVVKRSTDVAATLLADGVTAAQEVIVPG